MWNARGEIVRRHPDDMRLLLMLAQRCRMANTALRRMKRSASPRDIVQRREGAALQARVTLDAAKGMARYQEWSINNPDDRKKLSTVKWYWE